MLRLAWPVGCACLVAACAAKGPLCPPTAPLPAPGGYATDGAGRPLTSLEAGSSLLVGARGLEPERTYEFRLSLDGAAPTTERAVSFARATTDRAGEIPPFVLWYQAGVVACSQRAGDGERRRPHTFRTFEEGERALANRRLTVTVHAVQRDQTGRIPPMKLRTQAPVSVFELPVVRRTSPMVFASTRQGCLLNSEEAQREDMYVSGRNFEPGETVEVSVVPNQRAWRVGDGIEDVTGVGGPAPKRVQADRQGRFTLRVWEAGAQRRGTYDLVTRRRLEESRPARELSRFDLATYGSDTAFLLFLRYPPGGPTMDIAGRPLPGPPYFEFADSFARQADPVWGAVDPTYVPLVHAGGSYAAYYVVNHRDVAGWDPLTGSIALADVTPGIEIMPVKAGCVNGTDVIIWNPTLVRGDYDVVVDFGSTPAESTGAYVPDGEYNEAVDFLDGADQVGFVAADDPYDLGPLPIGRSAYTQDDFFPTLGTASAVDLRAVVRYPATATGVDTTVAPGAHPVFVIEHGNHDHCDVCKDAAGNPEPCNSSHDCADLFSRAACPQRTLNHEGYMRLLDILASHGIIAVSVDAYDLTGWNCPGFTQGWIQERGALILKHLELWSHMNNLGTFTTYPDFFAGRFVGHVDLNKVSVSGHSRGGEASVSAFLQNTNFGIVAVSSIAPVDFHGHILPDVPYYLLLPSGDGDVSGLSGQRIYDRAGSTTVPADSSTKSETYIYGANHNFFNTVWADDGDEAPVSRPDYIPKADQQRLGEAYLAAFTRVHLAGETVYEDMLRGRLTFPSTAGYKIYSGRHEKSHSTIEGGSGGGFTATSVTAASVGSVSVHPGPAVKVTWSASGGQLTYAFASPRDATPFEVLAFRVAQSNATTNPATGGQDFQVELVGGGKTMATYAGRFDDIPKPYDHPYYPANHNVMTTVRIPLHSFIMNKSGVTLNSIDTVRFRFTFPSQGEIYVDDVEFSR